MRFFEQYFLHIRVFHSYDKMDPSTCKSANLWLKILEVNEEKTKIFLSRRGATNLVKSIFKHTREGNFPWKIVSLGSQSKPSQCNMLKILRRM